MNLGKYARLYAIVTQGLIALFLLVGGGYVLGRFIDNRTAEYHPLLPGFLAVFGAIAGLTNFIVLVLKERKNIDALEAKEKEEANAKKTDE